MEGLTGSLFLAAAVLVCLYCLKWVYDRQKAHQFLKMHGFAGPEPNLFLGNHYDLGDDFMHSFEKWKNRYGKLYGYYVGSRPTVVLHEPEMIKECMIRNSRAFLDRPPWYITSEPYGSMLGNLVGDEWKSLRSALTPIFTITKIKLFFNYISDCATMLLDEVNKFAVSGESFNFYTSAKALTFDIISQLTLALKLDAQRDHSSSLLATLEKTLIASTGNIFMDALVAFPQLGPVAAVGFKLSEGGKALGQVLDSIAHIVSARRHNRNHKTADILQLMLDVQEENNKKVDSFKVTDQHILSNSLFMCMAGYETTSTAIAFAVYAMSVHQNLQDKLFDEISQKRSLTEEITYEDVHDFKYLEMFFCEVLRMYPPVTNIVTRECSEDITVQGRHFPKGCVVQAPVYNLHHDPELWEDPETFDPERFSDKNRPGIHPCAFVPFGVGPRYCIGMRLAQTTSKLLLSRLVKTYRILPCEKTERPLKLEHKLIILRPKNGVHVKLQRRQ